MLRLLAWALALAVLWFVLRVLWGVLKLAREVRADDSTAASPPSAAVRAALARAEQAPPNRRRWALSLADILLLRNGLRCDCDELVYTLPDEKRAQLAKQLARELDLPAELPEAKIRERMPAVLADWVSGVGHAQEGFYEQLAAEGQVRDALAFDCARTAFLVRCIALLGWVPEAQAWPVLLLNAQRAQDSFDSWEDFGRAYARAREHWLRGSERDGPVSARATREVEEYLRDPDGNWLALPWRRYRIFDPQPLSP